MEKLVETTNLNFLISYNGLPLAVSGGFGTRNCQTKNKSKMEHKKLNTTQNPPLQQTAVISWVAVSERLPETNCNVLVHKSNGLITQMSYHAPFDSGKRLFHWWGFGTWVNQHSQVTHWMPMPEPPCL